ncbi:MAG TPA: hypothetical protein VMI52_13385 [Acetobacteraceae bacterium]|nr:hypothetical protein [Acetobacteraceae bacterium]
MARPIKLPNSRFPYARKVVQKDLRAILGRTEFKRPLRGGTLEERNREHRAALDEWEAQIAAADLRRPARRLGRRASAKSGDVEAIPDRL